MLIARLFEEIVKLNTTIIRNKKVVTLIRELDTKKWELEVGKDTLPEHCE